MMLAGVDGRLIAEDFLEHELLATDDRQGDDIRRALLAWRARAAALGPASSVRAVVEHAAIPLCHLLGYAAPVDVERVDTSIAATVLASGIPVALIVVPWGQRLASVAQMAAKQAIRRAAAWVLLFNGRSLRIVDATRLGPDRHLEFELALVCDDERAAHVLRRTATAAALGSDGAASLEALIAASERHGVGVCRSLRDGVLKAAADVLGALVPRRQSTPLETAYEQALTIVYRMLFLLFAEARSLVPLWHPVYKRSYSIESLRAAAEASGPVPGLWDGLRAIARLAHAGCAAGDLRVTPFNGRLFAPGRTPLADRRDLDDEAARRAVLSLSTRPSREGRRRITYGDLGVEQLGAVYETVLDYEPRIENRPAARSTRPAAGCAVTLARGSGTRKTTGTFYTPQPIADYLVRRTLAPLISGANATDILSLRIVDPAMGSGAFLVAACRCLAEEYEQALARDGVCHSSDIGDADRALMRRTIAERCLYGVDINPMAVQLARLSLWLATLAADRPLSFLDHRLQCGDSLLGAWLNSLRAHPQKRRVASSMPLFDNGALVDGLRSAMPVRFSLEAAADTIDQIRAKERTFAAITARDAALSRWKRVADAWCAAWFDAASVPPQAFTAIADAVLGGDSAVGRSTVDRWLDAVDRIGGARRFFHWELEFPEVFVDENGKRRSNPGFDAVIGNPPWEMMRADTGAAAARVRARRDLTPLVRFIRDSGVYSARAAGHPNRYQLFVERAVDLTRRGGRIGLVLPSGLATDSSSGTLRRLLFSRCSVDAIAGVDNHRGVFPIHRSVRFLLVSATAGAPTTDIACRLGIDDPDQLARAHDRNASSAHAVRLTPAFIERVSGPDLTIPAVRGPIDVAIVERAAALFPRLGDTTGWSAAFGRELNATDDRDVFRPPGPNAGLVPVIEGKHIEPFRVRRADATAAVTTADARARLRSDAFLRARLAYRDVASATNRLTLIATVLPAGCVSTHTVYCLRTRLPLDAQHFLCGVFNSYVANYLVRLRVTTHVTTQTVERLPLPTRDRHPKAVREIAAIARLLSRRHDPRLFALLNAHVAALYQLTPVEFRHVLDTFPLIAAAERESAFDLFAQTRN